MARSSFGICRGSEIRKRTKQPRWGLLGDRLRKTQYLLTAQLFWCTHTPMQDEAAGPAFKLELNPSLGLPLYRQIVDGIKELVAVGTLRPGDQLPSIRELSAQLRINPSSAVKAYSELKHEEVIDMDQGRGTFVRSGARGVAHSRENLLQQALDAVIARARTLGFSDLELTAAFANRIRVGSKFSRRGA